MTLRAREAPGNYYGYSIQCTRMLYHLLVGKIGESVSLEMQEDIAVHEGELTTTLEQITSALSKNPISDRSEKLWKTIYNWLVYSFPKYHERFGENIYFVLYVAQKYEGSLVQQMNDATTDDAAEKVIKFMIGLFSKTPASDSLKQYVDNVLDPKNKELLIKLIKSFQLRVPDQDIYEDIRTEIKNKAISESNVEHALRELLGHVKVETDMVIAKGWPAIISVETFLSWLRSFSRRYNNSSSLISSSPNPSEDEAKRQFHRNYIRQIDIIGLDETDKIQAANDYLRASTDRTFWSEAGEVDERSFKEFEAELFNRWKNKKSTVAIEHSEKDEVDIGVLVHNKCLDETDTLLEGRTVDSHFIRGNFHKLADLLKIGWHPRFKEKLDELSLKR